MVSIPQLWLPIVVSAVLVTVVAAILKVMFPRRAPVAGTAAVAKSPLAMNLALHLVYALVISMMVAYLAGRTIAPGEDYKAIFRVAATAAVLAYAGGHLYSAIWGARTWEGAWRSFFEGVVFGLLTGGPFGWLWPDGGAGMI